MKYLLKKSFFDFETKNSRQVIGIRMGSDPALSFANLFVITRENGSRK